MALDLVIVGAGRVVDGEGSLSAVRDVRRQLEADGARVCEFRIAPLRFGWDAPLPDGYLKSACAPFDALREGGGGIAAGDLDAVLVSGVDLIKSAFADRADERDRLVRVYGEKSFLAAFDDLAGTFRDRLSMTRGEFEELADCLFENYWATWTALHPDASRPEERWFEKVTPHFRGVDCANPSIDFEGALLVTTRERARSAGIDPARTVAFAGLSVKQLCEDGVEHIPEIVSYEHLAAAYREACEQAAIDVGALLREGKARVEIYTCFPPVPIAFLLATGLARDPGQIKPLLRKHPITISGGLNLGRAPWNNSTLNALVQATQMIREGTPIIGVHSNAALGYKQGFAVLTSPGAAGL